MKIRDAMTETADLLCGASGVVAQFAWQRRYPPTVNTAAEAERVGQVGEAVSGQPVLSTLPPSMAAEDFAYMPRQ
jgi:hippurate hydrolase